MPYSLNRYNIYLPSVLHQRDVLKGNFCFNLVIKWAALIQRKTETEDRVHHTRMKQIAVE